MRVVGSDGMGRFLKQHCCSLLLCRAARSSARLGVRSTLLLLLTTLIGCTSPKNIFTHFPGPTIDASLAATTELEAAVFAGGCFWGIEEVFQHVKGVQQVISGYSGGTAASASYALVSTGRTQHAESVHVLYDRAKVSYGQLLKIFFAVAHDPTQLDRQGPDRGPQYRSVIFYITKDQQRIADAYIQQLNDAQVFTAPIVTRLSPLMAFHQAEDYHQDYASRHPGELYIVLHDAPKVRNLQKHLFGLYVERMAMDGAMPN